jgi:Mitochondrial carrier protein
MASSASLWCLSHVGVQVTTRNESTPGSSALAAVPPQIAVASGIIKQDGVGALYRGLSAGLLRQATYTTARLGIYQIFTDSLTKHNEGGVRGQIASNYLP